MNVLHATKRIQVIAALVEGTSINATSRITGVSKHTILKLLKDMGCACASYHDSHVRNVRVRHLQAMEAGLTNHVWTIEELLALTER